MNFDKIHRWTQELSSSLGWLDIAFIDDPTHYSLMEMLEEQIVNNYEQNSILFDDFKDEVVAGFSRPNAGDVALQNLALTLSKRFHGLDLQAYHACKRAALFWGQEEKGFRFRLESNSCKLSYLPTLLEEVRETRAERFEYENNMLVDKNIDRQKIRLVFNESHLKAIRENEVFMSTFKFLLAEVYATKYFLAGYFDTYGLSSTSTNKEPESTALEPTEPGVKLTWQGDKKILLMALRQMKNTHTKKGLTLIKEDYITIARFLIQHVNGFENNEISTLTGQLTKDLSDPKGNALPLVLTEPD